MQASSQRGTCVAFAGNLELENVPLTLPSGEWLLDRDRSQWTDASIDDPTTAGDEIFLSDFMNQEGSVDRAIANADHFHRLYISLGHAARRHMPRLRSIVFELEGDTSFDRDRPAFFYDVSETPALSWTTPLDYKPDERVALAWGFRFEELEFRSWDDETMESYSVREDPLRGHS
ncbi:hypothetical protein BJY00DRAFT_73279 [Aspergillus carlsbadensis]|nr:hypothetical protein BJY00DRAFT_73279 [Aspergillus carlsbadensis]